MGMITVSRMYGAGGSDFAKKLAECLGWKYIDKEFLHEFCRDYKNDFCGFGPEDKEAPSFFEKVSELMDNRSFYKIALMASIYNLASKGSVVIAGRGAYLMLSDVPDIINLQVVRLYPDRVKAVADAEKMSFEKAQKLLKQKDSEKKEFISYYFDRDLFDPVQFHLVLNLSRVPLDNALDMVCTYGRQYFTERAAAAAKTILLNRLIEKRSEILLFRLNLVHSFGKITFTMKESGSLHVHGVIGGEHEKKRLFDALLKTPGVRKIEDSLKVGILSHILY